MILLQMCLCLILTLTKWCYCYQSTWSNYNHRIPQDVMVDVINELGLKLLAIHNENNDNNIAISPYGALSVLVALGEGLRGDAVHEIQHVAHIPPDIALIRVGLRDIHRHLKSYFIPEEGFLAGLTLSHDNVTLNREYENILRFYGYDTESFNSALYPDMNTTQKPETTTIEDFTIISTTFENKEGEDRMTTETERAIRSEPTTEIPSTITVTNPPVTTSVSTTEELRSTIVPEITTVINEVSTLRPITSTLTVVPTTMLEITETTTQDFKVQDSTVKSTTDASTVEESTVRGTTPLSRLEDSTTTGTTEVSKVEISTEQSTTETYRDEVSTGRITTEDSTVVISTETTVETDTETSTFSTAVTENEQVTRELEEISTVTDIETTTENLVEIFDVNALNSSATAPLKFGARLRPATTKSTQNEEVTTSITNFIVSNNTKAKMPLNRTVRSALDYVIARYYDDHAITQRPPPISSDQLTFLINGKFRENNINFMVYDTILPFSYIPHLDALALRFPLDSSRYYLLLVLPVKEAGIDQLICDLRLDANLNYIIKNLRYTHVKAIIPSFSLKGYVVLTSTFQKLGVTKVFEPRQADFSPMTMERDIYVTNIEQAITVTIRNYMDPTTNNNLRYLHQYDPILFKADHPFLYFVIDSDIQVTLMAGKIMNPLNSRIR